MLTKKPKLVCQPSPVGKLQFKDFKTFSCQENGRTVTKVQYVDTSHEDVDRTIVDNSVVNLESILNGGTFLQGRVEHDLTDPASIDGATENGVNNILSNSTFDKEL